MQSGERVKITVETPIERTPRIIQLEGIFDIPPEKISRKEWDVNLPLDKQEWNIGLIVGPSGSGKSTVLRHLFGKSVVAGYDDWPKTKSLIEAFPKALPIKDLTGLLNAVGFSSPPSWLKPFHVLSNGEQFRVTLARMLAQSDGLCGMDEFTSVVDRTVAQIGSAAVAKAIRQRKTKFVAASCHYDIVEWLQPDWIYEPHVNRFQWRSLQRRPPIELEICRVDKAAWQLFRSHHYLSSELNPTSQCFVAFYKGEAVAFEAVISFPHPHAPGWRAHRIVTLPDFQGVGIGARFSDHIASMFKALRKRFRLRTSAPGLRAYCWRSPNWHCIQKMAVSSPPNNKGAMKAFGVIDRMAETFEYVGPAMGIAKAQLMWEKRPLQTLSDSI